MSTINQDHDVWFLRYKVQRTVFLSFWAIFCPLTLLTTQKIKIYMEISSFYTCVPKTTTLWGAVPEIRSETKNFCHSGSFFAILTPPHHPTTTKTKILKTKNTIKWCMLTQIWSATDIFFVILSHFLLFLPDYWPWKSKVGKNVKNAWRY